MLNLDFLSGLGRNETFARRGARYSVAFAPEFGPQKSNEQRGTKKTGPGWVYVLKQPHDPFFSNMYFKVGRTKPDPDGRANELWATAVTLPLHVQYAIFSVEQKKLEDTFYEYCCKIRLRVRKVPGKQCKIEIKDREFVPLELSQIIWILNHCAERTDLATGGHLIAPGAMPDARRAIGTKLIETGIISDVFGSDKPTDEFAEGARNFRKEMLRQEDKAFQQSRKWARRVMVCGAGAALVGVALARTLNGINEIATAELAVSGVAAAALASFATGHMLWSRTVAAVRPRVQAFGRDLRTMTEGQGQRARRAPLLVAVTGPDPRPVLFQSPERRAGIEARKGDVRHRRIIDRVSDYKQRAVKRMARARGVLPSAPSTSC
jgi:hypothetical protein